jgi:diaminopimelate decarboxylase
MKANSTRTLLRLISGQGIKIDASSVNEVRRARLADIDYADIMLTTQETPEGADLSALWDMIRQGLKYNVCSLRQLKNISEFAGREKVKLAMRIHPGIGSGESASRNTGDNYSCFGIHLSDIGQAMAHAREAGLIFDHAHVHIGSGADPEIWRSNIDLEMDIIKEFFPEATAVSFGGGLREARMPDETAADIHDLGTYAKRAIEKFYMETGRRLHMEVEPGTYILANAGLIVTSVMDKKTTGPNGLNFLVLDGGMELNSRPLMYASRHPFYVIDRGARLLSSEFGAINGDYQAVIMGRCCESGDSQTLDAQGLNTPRMMAQPEIGDYVAIGGAGAYCSAMSPMNYNSHEQAPEILYTTEDDLLVIRAKQTLEQIIANEV